MIDGKEINHVFDLEAGGIYVISALEKQQPVNLPRDAENEHSVTDKIIAQQPAKPQRRNRPRLLPHILSGLLQSSHHQEQVVESQLRPEILMNGLVDSLQANWFIRTSY